ncbi:S-adenosyl-L-methionine-dependent methyltransferase [Xylariales sp. PMI_506]|nr:S-adenosyl-L-methionine-dependent methyltransferase [Xylariales sp. PMI_506]
MYRIVYDGWLSLAPLSKVPKYVLDVGTGTGLWAYDFAEQNPSSYVIGADLSAIQPTNRNIPNCEFVKADMEDDWVFVKPNPDHQGCLRRGYCEHEIAFDYVHIRLMFSCFDNPKRVIQQAFDNLPSGGWIEFQETSCDLFQGNPDFYGDAFIRWGMGCVKGAAAAGRDITLVHLYKQWLEEIGFVDVRERRFIVPCGEWPSDPKLKLIGMYALQNMLEGVRGMGYKMLKLGGMTTEETEALIRQCIVELQDPQSHSYWYSA